MTRRMTTPHVLTIQSRGPWDASEHRREYVAAHCSCRDWNIVWTIDDLHKLGPLNQDSGWARVERRLRRDHHQHARSRRDLHRRAQRDPNFY